ncbi:MAG: TRAP transporter fused permease subunit [Vicinamibacterales bacterium]|nr:TRAP transporter fused permease subunit [Vicinamibacterales bacterium]HJN45876.1 TRAP transporter fused permease subunit [Vicinamibacterales bacterium]
MLSVGLCVFTLLQVNYPILAPQPQLAVFALLGLVICFLNVPVHPKLEKNAVARAADVLLALAATVCCGWILVQNEPFFEEFWQNGSTLGNRAGSETSTDITVGVIGLLLVIEAARRSLGLALPILSGLFLVYAYIGPSMPDWFFPHRGYSIERIVAQAFLQAQGTFGVALGVMFTYVFLFVIFGAFLGATGATRFIIDFAQSVFGGSPGGPAKVAVLSSGLMGSLSGSAVANTATTGTFTIPMMRSAGFKATTAAGIQAAASSGGALMPPVMGAGAYMMLEIVDPPVTYLQIIRAALIPAILYYLSLFLITHFHARRTAGGETNQADRAAAATAASHTLAESRMEGIVFATALGTLIVMLILGYTPFRAVSVSLLAIVVVGAFNPRTRLSIGAVIKAFVKSSRDVISLVAASASVGIIIGIVTLTGIGTRLPAAILPLAEQSLFLALVLLMLSSIVLGMGLPSAVCYLLLATLIGPVLGNLGVVPLAAHLFIFYFGMMSMVTPPVALAGYAAASIAGTSIMPTSFAAFRFALVGFTLPYIFVYRPELLMLTATGETAGPMAMLVPVAIGTLGVVCFASGITGQLRSALTASLRIAMFVAAALLLAPGPTVSMASMPVPILDAAGVVLFGAIFVMNRSQ